MTSPSLALVRPKTTRDYDRPAGMNVFEYILSRLARNLVADFFEMSAIFVLTSGGRSRTVTLTGAKEITGGGYD